MKNLRDVLILAKNYIGYALLNIFYNLLAVLFSVFSFVMIIPVLEILFNKERIEEYVSPSVDLSVQSLTNTEMLKEYFYYHVGRIINQHGAEEALIYISGLIILMFFLKNITRYAANYYVAPLRNGVVKDLRKAIYHKIMILPLAYFTEKRKGDILSRISSDVLEVEWSILNSLEMIFREPVTLFIYLLTLFIMSPYLTLFVLIFLPIMGYIIGQVSKSLKKSSYRGQTQLGDLMSIVEESLGGLRIIKAFTAIGFSEQRFEKINDAYTKTMIGAYRKRDLAAPMSEFLGVLVVVVIVWYGGSLVLNSDSSLTPSVFLVYISIFSQVLVPAKMLSKAMYNVQKGAASLDRINTILDAEEVIVEQVNPVPITGFLNDISYRNVSFSYEEAEVLKGINLVVPKGKTVALVGPSGSGKTTMVDLLPRFYDVKGGRLSIDGKDVREYAINDLRALMGIVNQNPILFNDTVANNIALGIENVSMDDVETAARIANAHEFIAKLPEGYNTSIGESGTKLSGGQRQRISIARAIMKNPPILILDEATSALDTESERMVQGALEALMKNRTSIVIAHRLSTIRYADEIVVLHDGEIIERGTHEELFESQGMYRKLCDMQTFG